MSKSSGPRINPDSRSTLWLTVVLICTLGLTSFMVSFNGLHDVAGWVGLPVWMRWAVPVFIDIAILAYSMAAVIHRAREEKVWPTWTTLGVFTLISVIANAAHALAVGETQTQVQSWIGAIIAAMAPVAVFAATEEISHLAFAAPRVRPEDHAEPEPVAAKVPQVAAETATTPAKEVPASTETPQQPAETVPDSADTTEQPEPTSPATQVAALPPRSYVGSVQVPEERAEPSAYWRPQEPTRNVPETQENASEHVAQEMPAERIAKLPERPSGPAGDSSGTAMDADGLIAWVKEHHDQGTTVTGKMVGAFLGKSDRTGRNRLNALKDERPELFELEEVK